MESTIRHRAVKLLTSAQVRAGDARAKRPAAAPFRLAKFTSKSVPGAHAVHVGSYRAADAGEDAVTSSGFAAKAVVDRRW